MSNHKDRVFIEDLKARTPFQSVATELPPIIDIPYDCDADGPKPVLFSRVRKADSVTIGDAGRPAAMGIQFLGGFPR